MRTKHLNQMKIIEFLLSHRETTCQQIQEQCKYVENIHPKTLARTLNELVQEEYLVCENKKYSLNTDRFLTNKFGTGDIWQKLLSCAIEGGEIDCYKRIRDFIKPKFQKGLLNDEALMRFRETIIEDVRVLKNDESTIRYLRSAIQEETELQIEYKGNKMQIVPLCILISRDGIRSYLYGVRRKTLLCFELSQIHILQSLDKKPLVNRDGYMEKIRKSWDIDIHEPIHIKILLKKYPGINPEIESQLQDYLGKGTKKAEDRVLFESDVIGINDFKRWLRENMDTCFLIEPENLRKELMEGVRVKIERYEHNG